MEHIKDSIKEYGINDWIECDVCEHMCHPKRINHDYYFVYAVCDVCYN